jgi:hypothetical protein
MPTEDDNQQQQNDGGKGTGQPVPTPNQPPSITDPIVQSYVSELIKDRDLWKRRHSGLQGQFSNANQSLTDFKSQHDTSIGEYEGQVATYKGQVDTLTKEREALLNQQSSIAQTVQEKESELAKHQRQVEIQNLLLTPDYSGLIDLYASGGIRPFDNEGKPLAGDDLKGYFDTLKTTVGNVQTQRRQQDSYGSRQPPPSNKSPEGRTAADLQKELLAMPRNKFGSPDYWEKYNAWKAALEAGSQAEE